MVHSLRALDTLCLGSNWIRELPPWLGDLHLLRHLDVSRQIRAPWQARNSNVGSSGGGEGLKSLEYRWPLPLNSPLK